MLISNDLAKAINDQVGHEYGAMMQYMSIGAYFDQQKLKFLSKLFFDQANEEKTHAEKLIRYLLDTQSPLQIPAIPAPKPTFANAEEAVEAALKWETEVTRQITGLMDLAVKANDYMSQGFLQWFVDEQLEEIAKMDQLLNVVRRSGERNLLMVEAYLVHISK